MTLYKCKKCGGINAPIEPDSQLLFCWTCSGEVEVVSDLLPFENENHEDE